MEESNELGENLKDLIKLMIKNFQERKRRAGMGEGGSKFRRWFDKGVSRQKIKQMPR